jgi:hypothetical protein
LRDTPSDRAELGLCETSANARGDEFAGETEFFVQSGIGRHTEARGAP